jgi:hypothetical protein
VAESLTFYEKARVAVQDLMTFLASPYPGDQPLCVTSVFLGNKSSVSYYTPAAPACVSPIFAHVLISHCRITVLSFRLNTELRILLAPYIALDFDQNVSKGPFPATATIDELQSLEHLAIYGRPMCAVLFSAEDVAYYILGGRRNLPEEQPGEMVRLASSKLTNGVPFSHQGTDHVFAVLSQRLCLEPVLVGSEVIGLTDRSVAHHMRLITGISDYRRIFYIYSPSEPIPVLGAVNNLYSGADDKRFGQVLDAFSKHLCSAGFVEKGLIGELGARILLILARDFAASMEREPVPKLFMPVPLLTVIDTLFATHHGQLNIEASTTRPLGLRT